jgi:DNA ligase-1
MPDLQDGETAEIQGSAAKPYVLKNIGGVYSCSCPAWRNQSLGIERRTCKHLISLRGEEAERARLGQLPPIATPAASKKSVPALLLAETWQDDTDVSGWWLSEKLDGVRAYWTGEHFMSRQGNRFYAPAWFVAGLPPIPLDGELWLGRKRFQRAVSIVRRQDESELWRELKFVIFDAPACNGVFENRVAFIERSLNKHQPAFALALHHYRCQGTNHLHEELARINSLGGEGLMLRQPGSQYEAGRSTTLLKLKRFHDAEAQVIGHQPGAGRHKGRLGALLVQMPDGTQFAVGTGFTDSQRESPPAIGSVITFRFQELTDGRVPRFPSFVRVRRDAEQAVSHGAGAA